MADLLKSHVVDLKSSAKHVLTQKDYWPRCSQPNDLAKRTNDVKPPVQAVKMVDCEKSAEPKQTKWLDDFTRNDGASKIGPMTTLNAKMFAFNPSASSLIYRPENGLQTNQSKWDWHSMKKGHDASVQNRLKINESSKRIGGKCVSDLMWFWWCPAFPSFFQQNVLWFFALNWMASIHFESLWFYSEEI